VLSAARRQPWRRAMPASAGRSIISNTSDPGHSA
jgi:hypothetical protein